MWPGCAGRWEVVGKGAVERLFWSQANPGTSAVVSHLSPPNLIFPFLGLGLMIADRSVMRVTDTSHMLLVIRSS